MTDRPPRARPGLATAIAAALIAAGLIGLAFSDLSDLATPLTAILAAFAVGAELVGARFATQLSISAGFVAGMLAVGFLGPAPAFVIPALMNVAAWAIERYRRRAPLLNIARTPPPTILLAYAFEAGGPAGPRGGA